jgi:hypothetical protein
MTLLGGLAMVCAVAGIVLRRPGLRAVALGFGAGVPASAGVVVGPVALSVFVVVAAVVGCSPAPRSGARLQDAAVSLLVAFGVVALVVTAVAPWVFAGTPVLEPGKGVDLQVHAPASLTFTIGNAAQCVYLVTAVAAARFLWRTGTAPIALLVAAWTGTVLSAVRGVLRALALDRTAWLFDTLGSTYSGEGDTRLRGVFAEPSELAAFSLAVVAFAAVRTVRRADGGHRTADRVLLVVAGGDLLASASGTAVVAGCLTAAALVTVFLVRFVRSEGVHAAPVALTTLAVAFVTVAAGPDALTPAAEIVADKLTSQSLDARSAADAIGMSVLADTAGFGAGDPGGGQQRHDERRRPVAAEAGTGLFLAAVLGLVRRSARTAAAAPAAAGLFGLLVAKTVSAPDLSTPLLWVLIATCVQLGAARERLGATLGRPQEYRMSDN